MDDPAMLVALLSLALTGVSVVIAAATFAYVYVAERRFRRRWVAVQWWLHFESDKTEPEDALPGAPRYYHYTLTNLGTESATHVAVGATSGIQSSGSIASFVKSGENFPNLRIESSDFDNDWLLVDWMDATDRRYVYYQWFALNPDGPLREIEAKQLKDSQTQPWYKRLRRKQTKAVGPDGVRMTRVRTSKNYDHYMANHGLARSLLEAKQENRAIRQ